MCVLRVKAGFSALERLLFHMGKSGIGPIAPNRPAELRSEQAAKSDPSCLPSLPLSGDFNHLAAAVFSAKAPLHAHVPLHPENWSSLCIYHLFG